METKERKKLGASKRKEGKDFEKRVYSDLVEKCWIVNRWSNDVKDGEVVQAKMKWLPTPRGRFPVNTTPGFPDFICFLNCEGTSMYKLIAVESKITGVLDKLEKEKCQWYLDNKIFSKIFIAIKHKIKNRIHIEYKEFNVAPREKSATE